MSDPDRIYLTVLKGPNPKDARPILAVEDPELAREILHRIRRKLDVEGADDGS